MSKDKEDKINFQKIEKKWQDKWEESKIFESDPNKNKKKFYITVPYPYVSGPYHIGHGRAYSGGDMFARYWRSRGFNVLFPMAFHITGTPVWSISKGIKRGDKEIIEKTLEDIKVHTKDEKKAKEILKTFKDPWKVVEYFSEKMKEDFKSMGMSIDWRRDFTTGDDIYNRFVECIDILAGLEQMSGITDYDIAAVRYIPGFQPSKRL